jgi:hypothetical protein
LRLGMLLTALLVAACLGAASAAAAPADLKLDPVVGEALPSAGGKVQVSLVCQGDGKKDCKGRVEILGRGAGDELGSVLAGDKVSVDVDDQTDSRFELTQDARDYLREHGPLPVDVVVREADGSTATRQMVIEEPKLVPIGAPTVGHSEGATASEVDDVLTYVWNRNLRAGTAAAMGEFRCPAAFPLVAKGGKGIYYGVGARVDLTASEGVGYGAFDDVIEKPFWNENDFGGSRMWTMVGWWAGGFFRNSIWAPPFKAGHFRLSITCTRVDLHYANSPDEPAWLYQEPYKGGNPSPSTFMPWVIGSKYP